MKKDILNTANSELLVYMGDMVLVHVMGGIRLDGLDRMRVTLKVELREFPGNAMRHNLDLYNDLAVDKLCRRLAVKLEMSTGLFRSALMELTEELESYRMDEREAQAGPSSKKKELTILERKAAEAFLKKPKLIERTNEMIGKSGVVGEELNRLLMYLIFTSRKKPNPLHIVSLGASGSGKTHLQESVSELIPEEDKIEITCLSENAFYYFGQQELRHKLILIEDLDGADSVLYPLRELQSKKRISKTVALKTSRGKTRTERLVVEGPVSVAGCTTKERIYEDNANRSFLIYIDMSNLQDQEIMRHQRGFFLSDTSPDKKEEIKNLMRNCQRMLEPITVYIPFAEELELPPEVFKPRRTNAHYLDFISAVTFYHQFQRKHRVKRKTGEVYIESTLEDVEIANRLMKEPLLRKCDELSGASRAYLERVQKWMRENKRDRFSSPSIRKLFRIKPSNQRRWTAELVSTSYIRRLKGSPQRGYEYEVTSPGEFSKLKCSVESVLDQALERIRAGIKAKSKPKV